MRQLRLASSIVKMMIKDRVQYPGRLVVDTAGIIVRYGVLLGLYWYVFKYQGGMVKGVTFQLVAWSMFMYFALMMFRLRDVGRLIMQDVKTGTVELLFAKPIQYLTYRMWWQLGSGLYSFLVTVAVAATLLSLSIGIPETMQSWFFAATFVPVFFLAIILSLLVYATVALLAFWVEDVKPFFWLVDKSVMILGGSYLPIAFFPKAMYYIAVWSPFGAAQFVTHTVYETWRNNYLMLIGIQLFWTIVFLGLISWMFKRAHEKVSINGG